MDKIVPLQRCQCFFDAIVQQRCCYCLLRFRVKVKTVIKSKVHVRNALFRDKMLLHEFRKSSHWNLLHKYPRVCLTEWVHKRPRSTEWNKERQRERIARAADAKPARTRLSSSCCFTCRAAALLNTDRGWLVRAIPLQLNDCPTAPCPSGAKTLFKEEGSPWALLSLKLAANNPSNLVTSSATHNPPPLVPPAPVQTAPGA